MATRAPVLTNLQQQYFAALSKGFHSLWQARDFTDIDIFIEGTKFPCHRVILASVSHYFNAMFTSGMRESEERFVTLKDVDKATFENVLNFIYTGTSILTVDNVDSILHVAVMLQIKCLQGHCEKFLDAILSPSNCIGIWQLANSQGCAKLAKTSWIFLLDNFPKVWKCEEFLSLDKKDLISIIKDNYLNTPSEEMVCAAVMYWASAQTSGVEQNFLADIFGYLRLQLMNPRYIHSLTENDLVKSDTECMQRIVQTRPVPLPCVPAELHRQNEVMCVIGSRGRNPYPQRIELKCFCFRQQTLFSLCTLPTEPGPCFSVCEYNNDLFVTGGYMDQECQLRFVSSENQCYPLARMCVGRWGHVVAACSNKLYNFGGKGSSETLSSIEMLDLASGKSRLVGNLEIPVSSASVAVLGDNIYIFGGKAENNIPVSAVQCFDTISFSCKHIADLPVNSGGVQSCTVVYDNRVYILYGNGDIIEFVVGTPPSLIGRLENWDHFGAVCRNSQILIFGKQNNQPRTVYFDLVSREWGQHSSTINIPLSGYHCLKFVISKKHLTTEQ